MRRLRKIITVVLAVAFALTPVSSVIAKEQVVANDVLIDESAKIN